MKRAIVSAMFPELRGGSIYKTGRGKAGSTKPAISRAFGDLLRQVRGKRVSIIKCTVTIIDAKGLQNEQATEACA
jgi:hypothetical protein